MGRQLFMLAMLMATSFVVSTEGCEGTQTVFAGSYDKTLKDDDLGNNTSCEFLIQASPGHRLVLTAIQVDLAKPVGTFCKYAHLKIFDGPAQTYPELLTLCGYFDQYDNRKTSTQGKEALVQIQTDSNLNASSSFELLYREVPIECGGTFVNVTNGQLTSYNDTFPPYNYPNNVSCTWTLTAPEGERLGVQFKRVDFERCQGYDELSVYEGFQAHDSSLLALVCGQGIPKPIVTSGNELMLVMTTDETVQYTGFELEYFTVPKDGGTYTTFTSDFGTILSPNYPSQYPDRARYDYVIQAPRGKVVVLQLSLLRLELARNCQYDSLVFFKDGDPFSGVFAKLCGRHDGETYRSPSNSVFIRFASDGSVTDEGFVIRYHFEDFFPRTSQAPSSTSEPSTNSSDCNGVYTSNFGTIQSPNYPSFYDNELHCKYFIIAPEGQTVVVEFESFQVEDNEDCAFDSLKLYDGYSEAYRRIAKLCGDNVTGSFRSTYRGLLAEFDTSFRNVYRGFSFNYHFEDSSNSTTNQTSAPDASACNQTYTQDYGRIASPNFPENYPINTICEYTIQAPPGHVVVLDINYVLLEDSSHCKYDSLSVFDGGITSDKLLGKLCGRRFRDEPFGSSSEVLIVVFSSDSSIVDRGFRLDYHFFEEKTAISTPGYYSQESSTPSTPYVPDSYSTNDCQQDFTENHGTITSPNYPSFYPNSVNCTYNISAPEGEVIVLIFSHFSLESNIGCNYDVLEIYDGEDENADLVDSLCYESAVPGPYTSSSNHMFMKFTTDRSVTYSGFQLSYHFRPKTATSTPVYYSQESSTPYATDSDSTNDNHASVTPFG